MPPPVLLYAPERRAPSRSNPRVRRYACTALIAGSGGLPLMERLAVTEASLDTPYGPVAGPVRVGVRGNGTLIGLPRHGEPRRLAPHTVNYRANLWLLKQMGAERVVATYTVGAIDPGLGPGDLVLPSQVIDYTWGRDHTYDDSGDRHVDFTEPFDAGLVRDAAAAAERTGLPVALGGVYGCTQGPRLETAAEIDRLERDGCTLVGMTAMPEAALARELGLPLLGICVVVNPAAGRGPDPTRIDLEALATDRAAGLARADRLVSGLLGLEGG